MEKETTKKELLEWLRNLHFEMGEEESVILNKDDFSYLLKQAKEISTISTKLEEIINVANDNHTPSETLMKILMLSDKVKLLVGE